MRSDLELEREAEPHDEDLACQRIEIEFAIPVYLPQGALRELDGLLSSVVRMKMNQLKGHAHWVSACGAKPLWSQADAVFLGKTPADDAPETGEPRFDDSVYHIETTCIERKRDRPEQPKPGDLLAKLKAVAPPADHPSVLLSAYTFREIVAALEAVAERP